MARIVCQDSQELLMLEKQKLLKIDDFIQNRGDMCLNNMLDRRKS